MSNRQTCPTGGGGQLLFFHNRPESRPEFCACGAQLLHEVSLVVGHCRLLGEELRLLRMWGGPRLDILHIGCVDTL